MIKPTVGRVVWYRPGTHIEDVRLPKNNNEPLAAIITAAWSDILVNLMVMDANGMTCNRTSVVLVQDGGAPTPCDGSGYCEWMPYQIGQYQKTAEMQDMLNKNMPLV